MYSLIIHGRRSVVLQKWRNLTVKLLQNAFAFSNSFSSATPANVSPLQDGRKGQNFTVSYLVDSLGLTTKLAASISRKVSFEGNGNPDSVLTLLRSHGFTDSQISIIITDYPLLLVTDAEKSLSPKLQFLQWRGASISELTEILSKAPKILAVKEEKTIGVYYDFVKEVVEADKSFEYKKVWHSSLESSSSSKPDNKIRNVLVLRELGMPLRLLLSLLVSKSPPVCGKERFEESLKKVVEMGFDPNSSKFVNALRMLYQMSEKTIQEKVQVYKSLGLAVEDVWAVFNKWPSFLLYSEKKITQKFETLKKCGLLEEEVLSVFTKFPQCIGYSEEKIENIFETFLGLGFSREEFVMTVKRQPQWIGLSAETVKKKCEFLVKKVNFSLKDVVSNPVVLGISLEKRIVPRCNVIKALMSKGFLKSELPPPMSSVLLCTDDTFLNRYVKKHDDKELVAELMSIFTRRETRTKV